MPKNLLSYASLDKEVLLVVEQVAKLRSGIRPPTEKTLSATLVTCRNWRKSI
ncbi:MAG: hypothetical protein WDO15_22775 [Bacteroidota bacterium]